MKSVVEGKNRIPSLVLVQVISAVAVVYLHTNGCFWEFSAEERYWQTANIIECLFYFAVPVFFMISGVTLIDFPERYSFREYFRKRITKTVIPYIVWSLIGVGYRLTVQSLSLDDLNFGYVVRGLLNGQGIVGIYWFFPVLFSVYLCIPLFASVQKEKKKSVFTYLLIVGFVLNVLIPFIRNVTEVDISWGVQVSVVSGYLMWPLAGYLLHFYPPSKRVRFILYIVSLLGLLLHIWGTADLSMKAGTIVDLYKGYNNVPSILYATGVFVFLERLGNCLMQRHLVAKILTKMGNYTFPVYLMHWFVMDRLVCIAGINTRSIVYRVGGPWIIILIVIGITWIMRKIPIIRRIVP